MADVDVTFRDTVEEGVIDADSFHSHERRLEQSFRASETLVVNLDHLAVRKHVALLDGGGSGSRHHLLLKIHGRVAELLFDVTNDLALARGAELIAALVEDLHQVVGEVTPSQIQPYDRVGQGVALEDWYGVGYAMPGVQDDAGGAARSVHGQHAVDGQVHGGDVERLEHGLAHLLPVGLLVERGFAQQDGMFLGGHEHLVVEGVMPDLFHVVPVGDDAVLHGELDVVEAAISRGVMSHKACLPF